MITPELLNRINELARKKKNQGLTPAELEEQQKLYKIYLASIRQQVTNQLNNMVPKRNIANCGCNCQHNKH